MYFKVVLPVLTLVGQLYLNDLLLKIRRMKMPFNEKKPTFFSKGVHICLIVYFKKETDVT